MKKRNSTKSVLLKPVACIWNMLYVHFIYIPMIVLGVLKSDQLVEIIGHIFILYMKLPLHRRSQT